MSNLESLVHQHRRDAGHPVELAAITTRGKDLHPDKEAAKAEFRQLRQELIAWQYRLYAEGRQKLLLVFQAMDAGGKDGAIRKLTMGVNPQGVQVTSFKVPSKEELAHDFLWRIHKAVPANGMIGIFNRSHYEDVLVVRVDNIVPEAVWRPRYRQINEFERLLTETGTAVLKFYLHISPEEQRHRFQERVDIPEKNWKLSLNDLQKRKQWPDYMAAYEEMLAQTATPHAPWYIIPADQNWYRDLAVARVVVGTLRQMAPEYPPTEPELRGLVVE